MTFARSLLLSLCFSVPAIGIAEAQAVAPPVGPMTVTTAVAGLQPAPAAASVNYSTLVFFVGQRKVVGQINSNMPANTTLSVRLTAPSGGTSLGYQTLSTTPKDLVIAATPIFFNNITIAFNFTTTAAAGVIPTSSRTVTYTLLTYP